MILVEKQKKSWIFFKRKFQFFFRKQCCKLLNLLLGGFFQASDDRQMIVGKSSDDLVSNFTVKLDTKSSEDFPTIAFRRTSDTQKNLPNILDNTTKLWMTKFIIGEIFSSGGATLYKNTSDRTVKPKSECILGYRVLTRPSPSLNEMTQVQIQISGIIHD